MEEEKHHIKSTEEDLGLKEKRKNLFKRIETIIRSVSDRKMKVVTEVDPRTKVGMLLAGRKAEDEWFYCRDGKKEYVYIPTHQLLESGEEVVKGKAAHEAGHAIITRFPEFVPDEVLQQLGFHSMLAATEERPTDNVVKERRSGAGEWVKEARKDSIKKTVTVLDKLKEEGKSTELPKFSQLASLIVYEPYFDEIPGDYDPKVLEIYEKIREHIEQIEKTIPDKEEDPLEKAKERYKILYTKIWPIVKKLVDEDVEEKKQELAKELSKETTQKELLEAALKMLKDIEDKIVEEIAGILVENPAETHEEYDERLNEERNRKLELDEMKKEEEERKELQEMLEETKSKYDKTYEEIKHLDEELYSRLEQIFTPNIKRKMKLKSTGSKPNLAAIFRWESGRKGGARVTNNKIFETVSKPEKKDYVFSIMNDLSSSMRYDNKIEEDFKAKILLTEVMNRLNVKNEILGFHDETVMLKEFDKDLNDKVREKISMMLEEYGWTNTGPCLLEASKRLGMQPGKEKFIIILTDGMPGTEEESFWEGEEKLHKAVEKILIDTDQNLIGIGIGPDTDLVEEFFPASLPNISVDKLVATLSELIEDIILNPQKYHYNK